MNVLKSNMKVIPICKSFFINTLEQGVPQTGKSIILTFWCQNYFFNFSTSCILNVNNTGTKYVRIMKQTAF